MIRGYKSTFAILIIILLSINVSASIYHITPSDTVQYLNSTETVLSSGTNWFVVQRIVITNNTIGSFKVGVYAKSDDTEEDFKIRINDVDKSGLVYTLSGGTYTYLERTLTDSLVIGDVVDIYAFRALGHTFYYKNMSIRYNATLDTSPTVPVTTQHLNYFNSSSTTVTWAASTDADGDTIHYGVKVGTSSGATDVLNYNDTDTTSNSFTMTPQNSYYYSVRACDAYGCSSWSAEKSFGFAIITPYTPANGSSLTKDYPPLTDDVSFTWSEIGGGLSYNLKVAKDINFNLITVDTTTANNYSTQSLEAGNYWWKVQYYNSTSLTYYNWSIVSNFTLSNTQSTSGTAIQGTVSELVNGVPTPLSEVTVYIQSSAANWSSSMVTGTNGYYLFDGLTNGTTYYVYASKTEYTTSTAEYVTTGAGTWTTKNILLKKTEPTDFESDKQYVKFRARWLWCFSSCDIAGTTISAYKSGEVIAYASGVTDSTGTVSFRLYKAQLYRITVVNTTAGISQEMTLYPKDTEYVFLITNAETSYQDHLIQEKDAINIAVTKAITNATSANITVNYTDSLSGTTALTYYLNQSNNTMVQSWTWAAGSYNHTFTVSPYSGNSYVVRVVATQSTYGTIDRSYAVPFEKSSVDISGISSTLWLWFAIAFMFFTGAIFTSSTAEKGLLIVCAEGWIFFFIGMFASLNAAQFVISLTLASVIAVFAYFKKSHASEGFT